MSDIRRQKLIDIGAEALADALLDLAELSEESNDLVERLIATPTENIRRFKKKLANLSNSNHFIHWRESADFANELKMLLRDLKAGVSDSQTGIELLVRFFEADSAIFERCDDSSGDIGDIFRCDAKLLFVDYASRYSDKERIAEIVLKLSQDDGYGVRDALLECAGEYLPEPTIRSMISTLEVLADSKDDEYDRRHFLNRIESLARQIKDAKLFEETRIASWGEVSTSGFIDIAEVYLESGDVETAHSWLKKIPQGDERYAYERDELLLQIYREQGDSEKLSALLLHKFQSYHSLDSLQELLYVIGNDKREEVIDSELKLILGNDRLNLSDAQFLVSAGKLNEAEDYLIRRAGQLNGDYYAPLVSLAEAMESDDRHFVASLIYRSLLSSILKKGNSMAYPHGVRYLKKLDKLAVRINGWGDYCNHEAFKKQIIQAHGRKRSFWSSYN